MMSAVVDLLECYFARDLYYQVGCKANLLRLLYALAKHFWVSESLRFATIRQQDSATGGSGKIEAVFEFISSNYAEAIAVQKGPGLRI
jgi:hypothetical protein